MNKMRIVCAGMRRSGSTWQYNVARLIAATRAPVYARFEDDYESTPTRQECVKTHRFKPELLFGADHVLTCYRDPRDVAASAVRRRLVADDPVSVVAYLVRAIRDEFDEWANHATYTMRYEQMILDPAAEVQRISVAMDVHADAKLIAKAVQALPIGVEVDAETLLNPNHITDGGSGTWGKTLNPATVAAIEAVFGAWMRERNYL